MSSLNTILVRALLVFDCLKLGYDCRLCTLLSSKQIVVDFAIYTKHIE